MQVPLKSIEIDKRIACDKTIELSKMPVPMGTDRCPWSFLQHDIQGSHKGGDDCNLWFQIPDSPF